MIPTGYFDTGDKLSKVTEDGLRINLYDNGIVTNQQPYQSHTDYSNNIPNNFSTLSQKEFSDYTFNLFKAK